MNDYQALLRHLLDHPKDRVARLVFADWLEENGQPMRAEFVRISVAKHEASDPQEKAALTEKRLFLLNHHTEEILAGLPREFRRRYRFRFGLPVSVGLNAEEAIREGKAIFDAFPIPRFVLRNLLHFGFELSQQSWLRHIQELRFASRDRRRGRAISWLLASPHLSNLRSLNLSGIEEIGSVCEALRNQRRMRMLKKIDLSDAGLHGWALKSLCECPSLERVEELDLSRNPLTDASGLTLTRCKRFSSLRRLNLSQPDHLSKAMRKRLRRHFGERVIL
jgi:uncharacterized protein (TIGR02996 family)